MRVGRAFQAAAAVCLIGAAAFIAAPRLDSAARGVVRDALGSLLASAERATGLNIAFDSISPSVLRYASVRNLRITAPSGNPLLKAGVALVYYDLEAIARGDFARAVTAVRIEDAALSLDLGRDGELLRRLTGLGGGGGGGSPIGFSVSGRDVSVTVSAPGLGRATVATRELRFQPEGVETDISLDGEYEVAESSGLLGVVRGPLSVSGALSNDLSRARLELGLAAFARDFELATQHFEATYAANRIELRKVRDESPLDAELDLDLDTGDIRASLALDSYAPSRALRVGGRLAGLANWIATPYTGRVSLSLPRGDSRRLSYEASVAGSLPQELLGRPVGAELRAKGGFDAVEVEYAKVTDGPNSAEYRGSFRFADLAPDGTLGLSLALMGGELPLRMEARVFGNEGEYALLAENLDLAGVGVRDLALAAARRGDQADFRASFILPESADPAPDLPPLRFSGEALAGTGSSPLVRCEGSASWGASPSVDLSLSLASVDLGPLRDLLGILLGDESTASVLSDLRLGGDVFLSSDFERLSWSAPDLAVVSRSMPGSYALLSLAGNLDSISVRKAAVSLGGFGFGCSGRLDFAKGGGLGFEASLRILDIPYSLRGSFAGGLFSASGDYGLQLRARRDRGGVLASAEARDLPVPALGNHFLVSVEADGRYASAEDWSLELASLAVVPTGEALARVPRLSMRGLLGPRGGELAEFALEDKFSAVAGPGRLEYALGAAPSARLRAGLAARSGPERYDLDLSYADGQLKGYVDFLSSPLARLGALPVAVSGSVDGLVEVSGAIDDPGLSVSAALRGGIYNGQPLAASASGSYKSGTIKLEKAAATFLSDSLKAGACSFSLGDASAKAIFEYSGVQGGEPLSFVFEGEGRSLAGGGGLAKLLTSYEAAGTLRRFKFGRIASADLVPISAQLSGGEVRLKAGAQGELSATYGLDGRFEARSRSPMAVRFQAEGRLDATTIDAVFRDVEAELPVFAPLVFNPHDCAVLAGVARGSFSAVGLLADPELTGRLDAKGLTMRIPGWVGDDIGPFDAPVYANGRKLAVAVPSIPVGKGAVSLKGEAVFDHWRPDNLKGVVRSIGGRRVRVAAHILGIYLDGSADVELDMELRGDTAYLSGDVTLGKGTTILISPEIWYTAAAQQPQAQGGLIFLAVNLDVGFDRGVQVIFPSKDFPVVSGYSDRGGLVSIHYDQATNDLLLKGAVGLRGGDAFYIQRNFYLKSARVVFNETIDNFDPRVTLLAELRDRNEDGPVLINLSANNAPIASLQPRLTSTPTMTEAQIAALLGQNLLGMEEGESPNLGKIAASGMEFIPQLNFVKAYETRVREFLGLDILYLKTQVLTRWALAFAQQDDSADLWENFLDETTLYAGKYLGDAVFVHGSASLVQEEDPLARSSALSLDLELGAEFDTPFGLLNWSVAPESPESLFINDQSISLSWKIAY